MADFLLSKGANLESCDERGWTGLMHCAFNGRLDILRCLLQRGALVEKEDFEGRTALVYAAFSGTLVFGGFVGSSKQLFFLKWALTTGIAKTKTCKDSSFQNALFLSFLMLLI